MKSAPVVVRVVLHFAIRYPKFEIEVIFPFFLLSLSPRFLFPFAPCPPFWGGRGPEGGLIPLTRPAFYVTVKESIHGRESEGHS